MKTTWTHLRFELEAVLETPKRTIHMFSGFGLEEDFEVAPEEDKVRGYAIVRIMVNEDNRFLVRRELVASVDMPDPVVATQMVEHLESRILARRGEAS